MSVTVYHIGPACVQCNQTKRVLDKLGVAYDEVDLREHPELAESFKAQGHLSAPVVVTDAKTWSGFKLDKLNALADHKPKPADKAPEPFKCHGVEWDSEDKCLGCEAVEADRERILAAFQKETIYIQGLAGVGNGPLVMERIEWIVKDGDK